METQLSRIQGNPYNTRQDYGDLTGLTTSIKKRGLYQPLIVRKVGDDYQLAFGSRRLRALEKANIDRVQIDEREISDSDMALMSLSENKDRKDLNPVELARAYNVGLKVSGMSIPKFAEEVGDSETKIRNYLLILDLPERLLKKEGSTFGELFNIAYLRKYSTPLSIELEHAIDERQIPNSFVGEIARSCARVLESSLPDKKKREISMKVIWEDYSQLSPRQYQKISEFSKDILEAETIKHNEMLRKTEKAREIIKGKNIHSIGRIPDNSKNLDKVTQSLRVADEGVKIAMKGDYQKASKNSRYKFRKVASKLSKSLELILSDE